MCAAPSTPNKTKHSLPAIKETKGSNKLLNNYVKDLIPSFLGIEINLSELT